MYGKLAHQASFQVEELPSQSLPPTSRVVSIPEEVYNHLLSLHSNSIGSGSIATLAQKGTSTACLATQDPWVLDSSATDHMIVPQAYTLTLSTLVVFPMLHWQMAQPLQFLVWTLPISVTTVSGLDTTNFSPNLSLSSVLYIPDFLFNLLSISKLTKLLNCTAIFLSTHCIF